MPRERERKRGYGDDIIGDKRNITGEGEELEKI